MAIRHIFISLTYLYAGDDTRSITIPEGSISRHQTLIRAAYHGLLMPGHLI
jgi:hypothetical protein